MLTGHYTPEVFPDRGSICLLLDPAGHERFNGAVTATYGKNVGHLIGSDPLEAFRVIKTKSIETYLAKVMRTQTARAFNAMNGFNTDSWPGHFAVAPYIDEIWAAEASQETRDYSNENYMPEPLATCVSVEYGVFATKRELRRLPIALPTLLGPAALSSLWRFTVAAEVAPHDIP